MTQHEWQQYPAVTLQVLCAPHNQWSSTLHWRSSSWPFISFIDVHRTWIRLNWQILSILVDHHPTQKKTGFNHGKCKSLYDRIIVKEALPIERLLPWSHASFVVMGQTGGEHEKLVQLCTTGAMVSSSFYSQCIPCLALACGHPARSLHEHVVENGCQIVHSEAKEHKENLWRGTKPFFNGFS